MNARTITAVLIGAGGLFYLVVFAFHLNPILNETKIPFQQLVPIFALATLLHACYVMGYKRAGIFFVLSAVISLASELAGTLTGAIFGAYYYTDVLGPKLFNEVPVVIPLTYFLMIYPCYLMANLVAGAAPIVRLDSWGSRIWYSALGAFMMTAWDLTLDPYMVQHEKAWVWENGGAYFGIPIQNYVGWFATIFVIMLIFRGIENKIELKPLGNVTRWIIAIPLVSYAFQALGDVLFGEPVETVLISPFVMGLPFLFAITALYLWGRTPQPAAD